MSEQPSLSAAVIVGLLADDARRQVVASLVLGATTHAEIAAASGLGLPAVAKALGRLADAGLVIDDDAGTFVLLGEAFQLAARASATPRAGVEVADDASPDAARVLRSFVRDGRLLSIPVVRSKRLVVLDVLAQEFDVGRRYSEAMVNLVLGRWHADTAALRRYLVDEGLLDRADGEYWRAGGTVSG